MEDNYKILIVEDEQDISEILQFNLAGEGFETDFAYSGEDALKKNLPEFDLLLLDVMLGGMSGYKLANIVRKEMNLATPIIFLTAKGEENDVLTGFNVGADDYISKPFSIREVIARVKAILKRGNTVIDEPKIISYSDLKVDLKKKTVTVSGENINLTRKEFEILVLLMKKPDQYLTREEILARIWRNDVIVTERNVDVNIARLRKKLGNFGQNIKGKSGFGYSFSQQ
jgi:two-component system, OmpR family, alkaline phosphatase synthesis response regulator PhoP